LLSVLDRFELAWKSGVPPRIEDFVPSEAAGTPPPLSAVDRQLLAELILTDLEHRWRRADPGVAEATENLPLRPLLEDYLARYPALGPAERLPPELLAEEYRVRHRWGDRPGHVEYARRFAADAAQFQQALDRIDAELAADAAGESQPSATALVGAEHPAVPGYEIVDVQGRGGMGVVYKARQLSLNRLVALKMIRSEEQGSAHELARLQSEAEAVARLQHPNVVQIYEVGVHQGRPFLALEFVEGASLAQQLGGTPLPPDQAAPLAETLARAVHHAHERGIVHRDLKPANILLRRKSEIRNPKSETKPKPEIPRTETPGAPRLGLQDSDFEFVSDFGFRISDFDPKITDFGLAKRLDDEAGRTQSGAVLGTPSYMAPEQAQGRARQVGPAADTYALGAILYEMLTGRPPFRGTTPLDTLEQVRSQEPVPPSRLQPSLPRDLETICLKCLAKEPAHRYASAAALAEDLRRFQAGEPLQARPLGICARSLRWARRRPTSAALVAVSAGAALLLAAGGVWSNAALRSAAERESQRAEEAQAQRQRAEGNFQLARAAVDRMLTRVAEGRLAQVPQLEQVRRAVLEDARDFYETFLRAKRTDPDVRHETASAYARLGKIYLFLGRAGDAEEAFGQALAFFEVLTREAPGIPDYRQELAQCHNNLGVLWKDTRRFREAEQAYLQALKLHEALTAEFPTVARHRADLATSHNNLGVLYKNTRRFRESEQAHRQALTLQEQLAAEAPNTPMWQQDVARSHYNLGSLFWSTGRLPEAATAHQQALARQQKLVADFPGHPGYLQELANTYSNLGALQQTRRQPAEAEQSYRQAVEAQAKLAADFPGMPLYRQDLGRTHFNLGTLLQDAGRLGEAEQAYRQSLDLRERLSAEASSRADYQSDLAITLNNLAVLLRDRGELGEARQLLDRAVGLQRQARKANPQHPNYPHFLREHYLVLAETLLRLGEHVAAAAAAAELVQLAPDNSQDAYQAARFLARSSQLAEKDAALPQAKRPGVAQAYAEQAIALLQAAIRTGSKEALPFRTEPDLASLRQYPGYGRLLQEAQTAGSLKEKADR
jgi:serine/threonine protein kinase